VKISTFYLQTGREYKREYNREQKMRKALKKYVN
jgi:hypothetical protein